MDNEYLALRAEYEAYCNESTKKIAELEQEIRTLKEVISTQEKELLLQWEESVKMMNSFTQELLDVRIGLASALRNS